jgi:hypothetical protein
VEVKQVRWLIALALSAAALRLLPLGWLHPLNYDEVEFFRATDWVRQGLVPYRDFWEHHTPLQWILFAPFSLLARGEGVNAVVTMRWLQVPLWIVTFRLANRWMRDLGIAAFGRWAALAAALAASWMMIPAIEYRIDAPACALYLAALVLAMGMRERPWIAFACGVALFLCGFANLRMVPLLGVTVLLLCVVERRRALWMLAGGALSAIVVLGIFAMLGGLDELQRQVWLENRISDRFGPVGERQFRHRLLVVFGIHILGTQWQFQPATVDPGGVVLLVFGTIGLVRVLLQWRAWREWRFASALLCVAAIAFVARMNVVYNYHFLLVGLLLLPFVAMELERLRRREIVFALLIAAWCVAAFASVLRGKELDRAYQDRIMKEAHARTAATEKVWSGAGWAIRREPAWHYWFMPGLVTDLVRTGNAEPYGVQHVLRDPPAAIVADYAVIKWLGHQPQLRRFLVRHYVPALRNLWIPAPNARLTESQRSAQWIVLQDGIYATYATPAFAAHPWFERPVVVNPMDRPDASRMALRLGIPSHPAELRLSVDGVPLESVATLRKGQRVAAQWLGNGAIGVFIVPIAETDLFVQPPPEATLEAAYPRKTHWPFTR